MVRTVDVVTVGVVVVGADLIIRNFSRPRLTVTEHGATKAASAASTEAPRHMLSNNPATSGPAGAEGAEAAARGNPLAIFSKLYDRNVLAPIDYTTGFQVAVVGGVARFRGYQAGSRSALWSVDGGAAHAIPWDTPPTSYDWSTGRPHIADAKRPGPVASVPGNNLSQAQRALLQFVGHDPNNLPPGYDPSIKPPFTGLFERVKGWLP